MSEPKAVPQEALNAAMKVAVALKVFPRVVDEVTYLNNWTSMERILGAAFEAAGFAEDLREAGHE